MQQHERPQRCKAAPATATLDRTLSAGVGIWPCLLCADPTRCRFRLLRRCMQLRVATGLLHIQPLPYQLFVMFSWLTTSTYRSGIVCSTCSSKPTPTHSSAHMECGRPEGRGLRHSTCMHVSLLDAETPVDSRHNTTTTPSHQPPDNGAKQHILPIRLSHTTHLLCQVNRHQ